MAIGLTIGPAQARGQGAAQRDIVASEAIRALRAKWVEPDAETTDANKIRRYESILREGRQIIREQPEAENLYMVRALMLQATRGLLIVGVDDVDRQSVIQLARDIVDSQAPPAWRFEADLLLTQLKLASLEEDDARAESIESFIVRYETTDMLAMAVMRATDMADRYGLSKRYKEYLERLKDELLDYEGVGAFLYRHGQRVPQEGRSFRARLPRVEGGAMRLPLETMGRVTIVIFWDPGSSRSRRHFKDMASYVSANAERGIAGIGIAVSPDAKDAAKVAEELGATFPQLYLRGASEDPVISYFGLTEVPSYFILARDGRIHAVPHGHGRMRFSEVRKETERIAQQGWRRRWRLRAGRSGLAMADLIHPHVSGPMKGAIEQVLSARLLPAGEKKIAAMAAAHKRLRGAATDSPASAAAGAMLDIALQRWRLLGEARNHLESDWAETARKRADEDLPGPIGLLAEYYTMLARVHEAKGGQVDALLTAFVARYDETPLAGEARMLGLLAAMEDGADDPRRRFARQLESRYVDQPRVRGFLRDVYSTWPEYAARMKLDLGFTDLSGKTFTTGGDLSGKTCVIHFWSAAGPIGSAGDLTYEDDLSTHYTLGQAKEPSEVVFIAVNVDGDVQAARELARKHPDWRHAVCEKGWWDPALRKLDVTLAPSSWILGDEGAVLVTDHAPDYVERLDDVIHAMTRLRTWHTDSVEIWYSQITKIWIGYQAIRASNALTGRKHKLKGHKRYPDMARWAITNGARAGILRSAEAAHERIIDAAAKMAPDQAQPTPAILAEMKAAYQRLEEIDALAAEMQAMTEKDYWPDWLPESQIGQAREEIFVIERRRGQVPQHAREKLAALMGPAIDERGRFNITVKPFWR
jgi:hypothetical protein